MKEEESLAPDPVKEEELPGVDKKTKKTRHKYSFLYRYFCIRPEHTDNKHDRIKATLRELVLYLLFLVTICIFSETGLNTGSRSLVVFMVLLLVFSSQSVIMFHYTQIMKELFLTKETDSGLSFQKITDVSDFWKYVDLVLLDSLYWEKWYNQEYLETHNLSGYVYYENKLLGLPRMRQLRVKSSDCLVTSEFKLYINPCYDEYTESTEDKKPFGLGKEYSNSTAWFFKESEEIDGFWFKGHLTTYSGSGFVKDLPLDKEEAKIEIKELEDHLWIQRGTRVIFITFTLYNANLNIFSVIRLCVEFPATGGAVPSSSIIAATLVLRRSAYNYFLLGVHLFFCVFIVYFILDEIVQLKREGLPYLKSFWNFIDCLIIVLSMISIVTHVVSSLQAWDRVKDFIKNKQDSYVDFASVSYWMDANLDVQAVLSFFSFIKVFKYIGFNKTMVQLSLTLSSCAKDLAGFFIMFFIVFLAFTQLGYLLFGSQLEDFSTFIYTLFRIILGDFNFHQLEQANSILGPIFFMLFVFFVFFVLINMFLAIINDTYSEIKSDVAKKQDYYIMTDVLREVYDVLFSKLKRNQSVYRRISIAARARGRSLPAITLDEFKATLYIQGYTDVQIMPLFQKYDTNNDGILTAEEQSAMIGEMRHQKVLDPDFITAKMEEEELVDNDAEGVSDYLQYGPFLDLSKRVEKMEQALKRLVFSVEEVIQHTREHF